MQKTYYPKAGEIERKWYAPGVGVVKVKGGDEKLKLVATSVRPR